MELCVDTGVEGATNAAERLLLDHLKRHAELDELVDLAQPMVAAAVRGPGGGSHLVSLDWSRRTPRLRITGMPGDARSVVPDRPPAAVPLAPGVLLCQDVVATVHDATPSVEVELPVPRAPEEPVDPVPVELPAGAAAGRDAFLAAATGLLIGPAASGRSERERAAILGASLAANLRASGQVPTEPSAAEAAAALAMVEESIGGDFFLIEASDRRAVLGNRRCPFAVDGSLPGPAICRFTSALAGRLAAGGSQDAFVVLDERLAAGDHRCRIVIDLDPPADADADAGHLYGSSPAGLVVNTPDDEQAEVTHGFRLTLALVLPRDKHSVVLARRLARHALLEAGAIADEAHDVELSLAEAAANVIEHSGPGDVYRVSVEVRPDTCELRVVDVGRGFDHESLSREMAHVSAEAGRGIALMHALMDQVRFSSHPEQGTIVHLVKQLRYDDDSPIRRLMLRTIEAGPQG